MLGRDVINQGEPIQLRDPQGEQAVVVPIPPSAMARILQERDFWVHITGQTAGFMYSFADDAVQLVVPGASPGVASDPIAVIQRDGESASVPLFRGRRGSLGQQLRGGREDVGGVAVFQFRNVHPNATADGNVPIELRAGIEGSPDDEEDERPTQVQLVVRNLSTGESSEPILSYIESNRSLFLHVPAAAMQGGRFDVHLRCLTAGRFLGLGSESLAVVEARQSFALNLVKSLLILWLLAILIITISIFCSTFLSWPIAIVLTLVLLLGHWGVEQLDDALQPGVGASIATDMGFRDPGQTRVVSVAVEALSRSLDTLANILPDISRFAAAEDIERGLAIPLARLGDSLGVVLLFGLPMLVLGYVFLRNKEVAP